MNNYDFIVKVMFIFIFILICFVIGLNFYMFDNSEFEYCKDNGYEGVSYIKSFGFDASFRCYKNILSETGIGYEVEYTGVIKYEDIKK